VLDVGTAAAVSADGWDTMGTLNAHAAGEEGNSGGPQVFHRCGGCHSCAVAVSETAMPSHAAAPLAASSGNALRIARVPKICGSGSKMTRELCEDVMCKAKDRCDMYFEQRMYVVSLQCCGTRW